MEDLQVHNSVVKQRMGKFGLMLLYSVVYRLYHDDTAGADQRKRFSIIHLSDGTIHVPISSAQAGQIINMAKEHERYEVGYESYDHPTGKVDIDGVVDDEYLKNDVKLKSVTFHHVFIREDYFDTVFGRFTDDRLIRFLSKKPKEVK